MIQFDTDIKPVSEVRSTKDLMDIHFSGRGGTDIDPVIAWANEKKPQLLLIFTDGYFNFSGMEYTKGDTVWLIHDNDKFEAPFGKTIKYEV
jgi:predicted metal-dependent peptidase